MKTLLIFSILYCTTLIQCTNINGYEINSFELTPYHEAIIIKDMTDVLQDFDNDVKSQLDNHLYSDDDTDHDIQDLLFEYQHYLDRAHKQRLGYIEQNKGKNQVPLLRYEKFAKSKSVLANNHNHPHINNPRQKSLLNPMDLFIPNNSKLEYRNIFGNIPIFQKYALSVAPKSNDDPSCYCKDTKTVCKCPCTQCLNKIETIPSINTGSSLDKENAISFGDSIKSSDSSLMKKEHKISDDTNIKIKIDIKLPKVLDTLIKNYLSRTIDIDDLTSKETSIVNLPSTYFNFPTPVAMLDLNNYFMNDNNSMPVNKFTIHKKKKLRFNNSNKKHRKKLITVQNIKLDPVHLFQTNLEETFKFNNTNTNINGSHTTTQVNHTNTTLKELEHNMLEVKTTTYQPTIAIKIDSNETGNTLVNTSYDNTNTADKFRIENTIETEFITPKINTTTSFKGFRTKREIISHDQTITDPGKTNLTNENNLKKGTHKMEKILTPDNDLLYWPASSSGVSNVSKNITAIILERENRKAKLNMSHETLRNNRTMVLQHAIFGDVDWNDMDTVAPVFISFVGKYINGILTFCSNNTCHSMKCSEKKCIHRVCAPNDRFNNIGHCISSNTTDSIATLESIMDLPSNVAFEIVDILQDKLLGNLFGKITLCINTKCITLSAYKKMFLKSKCAIKELNKSGHCMTTKKERVM